MAKIVVYAMAYRGDVFPYVPIASELARRGHDVVFVVPREFHPLFAAEPFRCAHSGTDFSPTTLDGHAAYVARWGKKLGGAMLLRLYFGKLTIPHLDVLIAALDAELADADLLLSHPAAAVVGSMVAEQRQVPVLVGDLFPMLVPTEYAPLAGAPYLGRRANRVLLRASRSRLTDPMTGGAAFRAKRAELGLPTAGWNVIDGRLSPTSNLALVPAAYAPPEPDWPSTYRSVGFTPWDGPGGGALDDEVEAFLDAGEPPVVVTLGTSAATADPSTFEGALDAVDEAGARALVLTSTAALAATVAAHARPQHLVRPFVPLRPVLARSRAMVHSGAHGGNALALLGGVPSVVVPCLFDQVFHARRQEELGTGVHVRRRRQLGAAVRRVLGDGAYAERAARFAEEIAHEDGTAATVQEVERLLAWVR